MGRQVSAPNPDANFVMNDFKSYEYMSESDESYPDPEKTAPTEMSPETSQLTQIQAKLKQLIGSETHLILDDFIDLMQKIAPNVSTTRATEMFNHIDQWNDGQVETKVLCTNEFLPRMILKLFQTDSNEYASDEKEDDNYDPYEDDAFKHMNVRQLRAETRRLQQWIMEFGQPAVSAATELQMRVNIYEAERESQQHKLAHTEMAKQQLNEQLQATQNTLQHHLHSSALLNVQHKSVLSHAQESENRWESLQSKLDAKEKELKRYKKLAKEMTIINDKYLKKNERLSEEKELLEEDVATLQQLVLDYENAAEEWRRTNEAEVEHLKTEMIDLKLDLESKTVEAQHLADVQGLGGFADNDIMALAGRDRTITIDRGDSNMPTMEDETDKLSMHSAQSNSKQSTLAKWYSLHSATSIASNQNSRGGAFDPKQLRNVDEDNSDRDSRGLSSGDELDENDFGPELDRGNEQSEVMAPVILDKDSNMDNVSALLRMGMSWKLDRGAGAALLNQSAPDREHSFESESLTTSTLNQRNRSDSYQDIHGAANSFNDDAPARDGDFEAVRGAATLLNHESRDSFEAELPAPAQPPKSHNPFEAMRLNLKRKRRSQSMRDLAELTACNSGSVSFSEEAMPKQKSLPDPAQPKTAKASSCRPMSARRRDSLKKISFDSDVADALPPSATKLRGAMSMSSLAKMKHSAGNFSMPMSYGTQSTAVIFEEAVTREAKQELQREIREELQEDFELKLHQKEIELQLKLTQQNETAEAERKALIKKYEKLLLQFEADLDAERNRRDSMDGVVLLADEDTKTSEQMEMDLDAERRHSVDVDVGEERSRMDDIAEIDEQLRQDLEFFDRVDRLFCDSSLLWAMPLTK